MLIWGLTVHMHLKDDHDDDDDDDDEDLMFYVYSKIIQVILRRQRGDKACLSKYLLKIQHEKKKNCVTCYIHTLLPVEL